MEVVKKISKSELQETFERGGLLCRVICEVLGKPKDYVEETAKLIVGKAKEINGAELIEYEVVEVIPQEKLFSTFAEMQILFKNITVLMGFCFDFMPSSIEVIEPEKFELNNDEFSSWLSELQGKLHQVDMLAKEGSLRSQIHNKNMAKIIRYNMLSHLQNKPLSKKSLHDKVGLDSKGFDLYLSLLIKQGDIIEDGDLLKISPTVKFKYESEEHES